MLLSYAIIVGINEGGPTSNQSFQDDCIKVIRALLLSVVDGDKVSVLVDAQSLKTPNEEGEDKKRNFESIPDDTDENASKQEAEWLTVGIVTFMISLRAQPPNTFDTRHQRGM